jgi:hypothetical protein
MPQSSTGKVRSISEGRERRKPQSPSPQPNEQSPEEKPATSVHPIDTHNKKASGARPNEQAKVLRQNVNGRQAQQHPQTPAGQHATGSFPTGTEDKNRKR